MTALQAGTAILFALILLLAAAWLRSRSILLTRYFVPASLAAGVLGLAAGPEVLGRLVASLHPDSALARGIVPGWMTDAWSSLPSLLINVVFAGLFLGVSIPGPRRIWHLAGPQIAFGQTIAWGQYVVGIALTLLILTPFFGLPPSTGALIEIAFEGGHGSAAGMAGVFAAFDFDDGLDLALGLATLGVVGAVVIGMMLVNWGARRGIIHPRMEQPVRFEEALSAASGAEATIAEGAGHAGGQGRLIPGLDLIEPLTFVAAFMGAAILLGWLFLQALTRLETALWADTGVLIIRYVPLFPFAMLGGMVIQIVLDRTASSELIDRRLILALQGLALDLLIASAIATLSIAAIGRHIGPFLILAAAGTAWCVFCFFVLAPRYMGRWWLERAIADFGQSMGMTASGLLLLRVSDPRSQSPAMLSFGYKQLFFEPIVGGGLFTASAIPLIVGFGAWPILLLTGGILTVWVATGLIYFGRRRDSNWPAC